MRKTDASAYPPGVSHEEQRPRDNAQRHEDAQVHGLYYKRGISLQQGGLSPDIKGVYLSMPRSESFAAKYVEATNKVAPPRGFEPRSRAPEAPRISTTL